MCSFITGGRQLLLLCSIAVAPAMAQEISTIAAQQLQRQQQREAAQRKLDEALPDARLPVTGGNLLAGYPERESPCFVIDTIVLQGEGAADFQWSLQAAQQARGRCLGSAGINVLLGLVQNALIARGYVTARVVAAPQDLGQRQLVLVLIPGRVHQVRFAGPAPATWQSALPMLPGELLNLRAIEQGLENFKRVPGAEADIQIVPVEQPGQSDLLIQWQGGRKLRASVSVDDSGSSATGTYQAGVTVALDNPSGLHDLFYVSGNRNLPGGSPAADYGTAGAAAHYSLPWHYWLFSLQLNDYRYHQAVAGAFQDYIYRGTSTSTELKAARLVYRDAARKTTLSVRAYQRKSRNFIDDTEVEVQRRRMGGFAFGLAHKEFIGSSTLEASLAWKPGTSAFGTLAAPEEAYGEGTSRPRMLNADLALQLPLTSALAWSTSWRGQWNRTPLVPQDRFAIGGRYTVRGFDGESSLSAERGWLLRSDLTWNLAGTRHQFYAAIDHGRVSGPSAANLAGTRLTGGAVGWRTQLGHLQAEFFAGAPIRKPTSFRTARVATGFNLNYDY